MAAEAAGRRVRVVWLNRLGGMTCEAGTGPDRWFVKWVPAASGTDLRGEAARLPVDRLVVCHGDSCAPNTLLTDGAGHVRTWRMVPVGWTLEECRQIRAATRSATG